MFLNLTSPHLSSLPPQRPHLLASLSSELPLMESTLSSLPSATGLGPSVPTRSSSTGEGTPLHQISGHSPTSEWKKYSQKMDVESLCFISSPSSSPPPPPSLPSLLPSSPYVAFQGDIINGMSMATVSLGNGGTTVYNGTTFTNPPLRGGTDYYITVRVFSSVNPVS